MAGRRGQGSLSFEHRGECQDPKWHRGCTGLWRGVTSEVLDGQRVRVKVSAKTKTEAQAKLKAKLEEQRLGVRSSGSYTMRDCVEDWIAHGLDGAVTRRRQTYRKQSPRSSSTRSSAPERSATRPRPTYAARSSGSPRPARPGASRLPTTRSPALSSAPPRMTWLGGTSPRWPSARKARQPGVPRRP